MRVFLRCVPPLVRDRLLTRAGLARFCHPSIRARQGQAIELAGAGGDSKVGAPSSRRHSTCGQGNIRAHPPVDPARVCYAHSVIQSFKLAVWQQHRDVGSVVSQTRSRLGAAPRGCRPSGGRGRRWQCACRGARRCGGPTPGRPQPEAAAAGGWRRRPESRASACGSGRPW